MADGEPRREVLSEEGKNFMELCGEGYFVDDVERENSWNL